MARPKSGNKRAAILSAATKAIAAEGLGASTSKIAELAGSVVADTGPVIPEQLCATVCWSIDGVSESTWTHLLCHWPSALLSVGADVRRKPDIGGCAVDDGGAILGVGYLGQAVVSPVPR
jgi:hypothetical protein